MTIERGSRVRFQAPLSDGGTASWLAVVVRVDGDVAVVRHPERARRFPFSPVATPGLYRYRVSDLTPAPEDRPQEGRS